MIQKAIDLFLGKNGKKRVNCAQAIASAGQEKFRVDDTTISDFKKLGGGNAPGKLCGAIYAAKYILDSNDPRSTEPVLQKFEEIAGSLQCREIRKQKKLSCEGCVEITAQLLDSVR